VPVLSGAQQGGADGGLELADLAGEDGVPDAKLAGCVVEAGLAGEGEEPSDALLGARAGEDVPDVRGECARSAEGGERVGAAGDAVPDADAGLAGCGGEGLDRGAGLGGDVLKAALAVLVLLGEPLWVDAAVRGRRLAAEPVAGEELPDGALAAPVMRAILRAPYPCFVNAQSCPVPVVRARGATAPCGRSADGVLGCMPPSAGRGRRWCRAGRRWRGRGGRIG
jgi:hypothetical protein